MKEEFTIDGKKHNIKDLFDYIASNIGFENKELIKAVKLFGMMRYRQGKDKIKSDNFYNLKDNPKEIIEWCESEIKEYQKLIDLIKKNE